MFNFMDCFVVWEIGRSYQAGALVEVLVKPIDYQIYLFFSLFALCVGVIKSGMGRNCSATFVP